MATASGAGAGGEFRHAWHANGIGCYWPASSTITPLTRHIDSKRGVIHVRDGIRPWYTHKRGVSFADILRTAQRALADVEVLDLLKQHKDLGDTQSSVDAPLADADNPRPRMAA